MRVFVTGVEGYIGCLLAPMLQQRGHQVLGTDTGYYRDGWLFSDQKMWPQFPHFLNKDLRHITADDLAGFDAIVHLAELSNDPIAENNPDVTYKINHHGSVKLANNARKAGVKRFVYTSSCSVYGVGDGDFLTEASPVNPQTPYARCKILVEQDLQQLASSDFSPTFLRNATAYGASPRMRFDIVLNNLSGLAWTTKRIAMTSDGTPWRPLVHVLDICKAICCAVEAPREAIHNQVLNVGNNDGNYRICEIAQIAAKVFPDCQVTYGPSGDDNRSYRVNFDHITRCLPAFRCEWDAHRGAQQLHDIFARIEMNPETFDFRAFTRLKQLKFLQDTGQIDKEFYWCY